MALKLRGRLAGLRPISQPLHLTNCTVLDELETSQTAPKAFSIPAPCRLPVFWSSAASIPVSQSSNEREDPTLVQNCFYDLFELSQDEGFRLHALWLTVWRYSQTHPNMIAWTCTRKLVGYLE
jgi:hypothetical protein